MLAATLLLLSAASADPQIRSITIPGTTVAIELVKVPPPPGSDRPLWVGRNEITWDQFDVFVYGLDNPGGEARSTGADAVARPSKPYVPPDRGFGHSGFPAMGMSHHAATAFCEWLTGTLRAQGGGDVPRLRFRLPTESEWRHFALAGDAGELTCEPEPECLLEFAWFADNSDRTTRQVGTRKPNAFGLHDVHGNVAEWVTEDPPPAATDAPPAPPPSEGKATNGPAPTPPDGQPAEPPKRPRAPRPLAKGGSYLDPSPRCSVEFDLRQTSAWNQSDPQIPKSTWWLSDCSFVGFRVVMEEEGEQQRRGGEEPGGGTRE